MKHKTASLFSLLVFLCLGHTSLKGEEKPETTPRVYINVSASQSQIANHSFWGVSSEIKYSVTKRLLIGINGSTFFKKIPNDYGFNLQSPFIEFAQGGIMGQYDVLKLPRLRISPILTIGYAEAVLGSRDKQSRSYLTAPLQTTVAKNIYPMIEPGVNVSIPFTKDDPYFCFTLSARHRFLSDKRTDFGTVNEFQGLNLSAGFSIAF